MRVEPCCQALLGALLPRIDPQRRGLCIDVGVGTFAFYCQQFAEMGYPTWAVEPLPAPELKRLVARLNIRLWELCLSNREGTQTLYVGRFAGLFNRNFSSLSPGWFGASARPKEVATQTLTGLLAPENPEQVTCLKLDIEGWEWPVIQQLPQLNPAQLPQILMFEYGGGASKAKGKQGWSADFYQQTLHCLETLRDCGYGQSFRIDFAPESREKVFNLQEIGALEEVFEENCVYGNIISLRPPHAVDPGVVREVCQPYDAMTLVERLVNRWVAG
ncbi:MAG: FkbM family methyltransferase [Cyanobacteriota bacterium]|jgi:FkbM family methyltransferase